MECPKCKSPMETVTYADIEVDRCTNCFGIWFDMQEHEDLKKIRGSEAIDIGDPKIGKKYNNIDDVNCPRCHVKMIPMVDVGQHHIWYESCSRCNGLFFDAGEFKDFKNENILDKIRDMFTKERD
ncbi:MAG: zf-TFIIB domain-containing protein [Leptospiraceae bacterium]|nr:zf-TFIIB domain-containing protein [Leptospiraceae bacterium]